MRGRDAGSVDSPARPEHTGCRALKGKHTVAAASAAGQGQGGRGGGQARADRGGHPRQDGGRGQGEGENALFAWRRAAKPDGWHTSASSIRGDLTDCTRARTLRSHPQLAAEAKARQKAEEELKALKAKLQAEAPKPAAAAAAGGAAAAAAPKPATADAPKPAAPKPAAADAPKPAAAAAPKPAEAPKPKPAAPPVDPALKAAEEKVRGQSSADSHPAFRRAALSFSGSLRPSRLMACRVKRNCVSRSVWRRRRARPRTTGSRSSTTTCASAWRPTRRARRPRRRCGTLSCRPQGPLAVVVSLSSLCGPSRR